MSLKDELATMIKEQRESYGLSQDRLASKAGISTRYYQDIEAAEKQPSLDVIFKLAKALECDYSIILAPVWKYWIAHPEDEAE